MFCGKQNRTIFALAFKHGALAQLVEQWTENPCVPGSIPGGTTLKPEVYASGFLFSITVSCLTSIKEAA